ncbi:TPA: hypothetical protein DEP34_03055 [Candidatus Uhrbacteria bacterium]|uniref:Succinylglutamate desuccinylase/aspartoacylase n=2 Tax=Candidatus Uhriibacteriota TaxID=1752732 RepID=A0A0G1SGZ8_9BACT|nr:MAG: Succinylglutamate desuccinylase/aspartoacylase [Candidatus Uhrbacteria bacterium GW2011_GWF2_46_218]KKU41383.1 MAG: Succinylglutamate desuccinylase/aspartoacylase [Candidatus Uhrbacteria bacterium GW2011_GWE2_46_68]HBK33818.1 hypothetical protein [Candidatus Uhrbacteria bacterium]HCB19341.1 hypothetical protein [Candidatus Uhrbacteria bacterium]
MSSFSLPSHICHLKGVNQDGPTVVILGGTHGDERTGVVLVKRLLSDLDLSTEIPSGEHLRADIIGNLYLGFGNPKAMDIENRMASDRRDLNRSFQTTDLFDSSQIWEDLERARELVPLFVHTDYLFDIHATNFDSPPFVCFGHDDPEHRELYQHIPVPFVLTDPDTRLSADMGLTELATTDYFVDTFGGSAWGEKKFGRKRGVGLCYETGQQQDLSRVEAALRTMLQLMLQVGAITSEFLEAIHETPSHNPPVMPKVHALTTGEITRDCPFSYDQGMNQGWVPITKGTRVGVYQDGQEVFAKEDGMLILQRAPEKMIPGHRMFFVAKRIG